jgi:hypothetical protein
MEEQTLRRVVVRERGRLEMRERERDLSDRKESQRNVLSIYISSMYS